MKRSMVVHWQDAQISKQVWFDEFKMLPIFSYLEFMTSFSQFAEVKAGRTQKITQRGASLLTSDWSTSSSMPRAASSSTSSL